MPLAFLVVLIVPEGEYPTPTAQILRAARTPLQAGRSRCVHPPVGVGVTTDIGVGVGVGLVL